MAPSFGRSISFQLSPARATRPRAAAAARHVRSISLPCRSSHAHPLLAHLQAQTAAARAWATSASPSPSTGLALIDALHAALAELLLLPEPQALVRRACAASDRLLDAFLLLADAHRGFQESLLALRRDAADARLALRRRDAARLASASRAQRRTDKELARLAAAVSSSVARSARLAAALAGTATAEEAEMAAALMDAAAASAAASAAVFSAVASVSAAATSSSSSSNKKAFVAAAFNKKPETTAADVAPEKLEELERCIDECESGSEVVFRGIVRTRVSLLNIRTPAI